jgi:O-antigen/teichoic acid export membrane protein
MGVTLYTSRVVLDVLGVEDYGIYNIVGGVVVLLSVISSTMRNATQRFITYELGQGDTDRVCDAFSMSMIAHLLISGNSDAK